MPLPKKTGAHGRTHPAPASARAHARRRSTNPVQVPDPAGADPPAGAAPRGGQVWAIPRLVGVAASPAQPRVTPRDTQVAIMLSQGAARQRERLGNEKLLCPESIGGYRQPRYRRLFGLGFGLLLDLVRLVRLVRQQTM